MRFKFIEIKKLPRLAWCVRIEAGNDEITVLHGQGVEVHDNWFFEGAWDGPFKEHGFANATDCFGTGGNIVDGKVVFVTPSHTLRALITYNSKGNFLLVSNSLPFLIAQTGDTPDIKYKKYINDLFINLQNGCIRKPKPLVMKNGARILMHSYCNIEIKQEGFKKVHKPVPAPPSSYEDFRDRLINMLTGVRENATDPARKCTYKPMIALSRGYDSVASAAMASAAGCKDSLTMVPDDPEDESIDDDGTPVAEVLGLSIEKLQQQNWRMRTDTPEVEFAATAWGGVMIRFSGIEDKIQNSLLILGNLGGLIWNPDSEGIDINWKRPRKQQMGGESLWEFQLRVGFITVFPATFLAVHYNVLKEIMTSDEMKDWSIGGDYDRPLPRRLAEDMGVPRELFGQKKMASSHQYLNKISSRSGHRDFQRFLRELDMIDQLAIEKTVHGEKKQFLILDQLYHYFFHWGIDRTRQRYMMTNRDNRQN